MPRIKRSKNTETDCGPSLWPGHIDIEKWYELYCNLRCMDWSDAQPKLIHKMCISCSLLVRPPRLQVLSVVKLWAWMNAWPNRVHSLETVGTYSQLARAGPLVSVSNSFRWKHQPPASCPRAQQALQTPQDRHPIRFVHMLHLRFHLEHTPPLIEVHAACTRLRLACEWSRLQVPLG